MLIFVLLATMFTANDLKQYCASTNTADQAYCGGFLAGHAEGVISGAIVAAILTAPPPNDEGERATIATRISRRIGGCGSEDVTVGQVRLIFLKYVDEHPEELHLSAARIVSKSLVAAFPCRQ